MSDNDLLVAVYERLGRMDAKLDAVLATTSRHGKRIAVLEKKWQRLFSWVTVVGSTLTVSINYLFRRNA